MAKDAGTDEPAREGEGSGSQPLAGCFVRLFWMVAGNAALLLIAVAFLREPPWTISGKDALYWLTVGSMVVLRYVDATRLGGQTAHGEPASRADVLRYSLGLIGLATLLWVVTHSLRLLA